MSINVRKCTVGRILYYLGFCKTGRHHILRRNTSGGFSDTLCGDYLYSPETNNAERGNTTMRAIAKILTDMNNNGIDEVILHDIETASTFYAVVGSFRWDELKAYLSVLTINKSGVFEGVVSTHANPVLLINHMDGKLRSLLTF